MNRHELAERNRYAERLRALEARIERLRSRSSLVAFYAEWIALQEWWLHAPRNGEALSILGTCLENAAWERARRGMLRARRALADGRHREAEALWNAACERLASDWEVFYRRREPPDPGELYERIRGP